MKAMTTIKADDGHQLDAYLSDADNAKAGLVVIQEIFGITEHLKNTADQFAQLGYQTIVPALFDRVEPGLVLPYDQVAKGIEIAGQCAEDKVLSDIKAAMDAVAVNGKVAVVGYCLGGTYAYLSACRLSPTSAISYYGTRVTDYLDEKPDCPILFHFGEKDIYVTPDDIELIRQANPKQSAYVYEGADHGFSCKDRSSYHPDSEKLAWQRTTEFLLQSLS